MRQRALTVATVLLGSVPALAKASEPGIGPIRFLACYGPTDFEGWEGPENGFAADRGAHNVDCYDASGRKAARMLHGPVYPQTDPIRVTFVHYDDRNGDGVLEDREIDGTISVAYDVSAPDGLPQRIAFGANAVGETFVTNQALVALEIAESQLIDRTGWFRGTTQLINRNNPVVHMDETGVRIVHVNFAVFSFLKRAVTMQP
jgi:hypothetical protein